MCPLSEWQHGSCDSDALSTIDKVVIRLVVVVVIVVVVIVVVVVVVVVVLLCSGCLFCCLTIVPLLMAEMNPATTDDIAAYLQLV
jgi:hypothetical protein